MTMPKQDFNINTRDSLVGNLYGISYTNSVRHTYSNKMAAPGLAADIAFGLSVAQSDEDRWCVLGTGATTADPIVVLGVSIRQINREPDSRPSAGNISYHDNEELAVLRDGFITVMAEEAVAVGARVYVDNATGTFWGAADGVNRALSTNMRWASSTTGASNATLEITSATMFAA
jgi:hypothetical protein